VHSKDVEQVVLNYLDDYGYISIGLTGSKGVLLTCSYGSDRIGKSDVYASVSNPVTSMIFFQMLENGLITSVNDPIGSYSKKYRDFMPEQYKESPVTFDICYLIGGEFHIMTASGARANFTCSLNREQQQSIPQEVTVYWGRCSLKMPE